MPKCIVTDPSLKSIRNSIFISSTSCTIVTDPSLKSIRNVHLWRRIRLEL